jgi:hypothetical protein
MYRFFLLYFILFVIVGCSKTLAQKDSINIFPEKNIDTLKFSGTTKKIVGTTKYNPRTAIIRSAILPGWGQITNKKYWKLPLVYGALGTTAVIFFRNVTQFKEARDAYTNAIDGNDQNDNLIPEPYFTVRFQPERIRTFRNQVRQNVDYSVLFFILFWGLNVVDAAVDAHLKTFDVSDNLSLQIKPGYSPTAKTNGISLVLDIKNNKAK